ncbi:hypothetical protein [Cystobacter fuscus]|uniref:hypothetical protein n=1 Tax=Cystobacter fuscus TaxID=43 RepID=UPI0012FE1A72|nr:hypothetical protein [Cystobacter fuscus]
MIARSWCGGAHRARLHVVRKGGHVIEDPKPLREDLPRLFERDEQPRAMSKG